MRRFAFGALVVLGLVAAIPLVVHNEYWYFAGYVVLQFIVLATAWNILGGYAGYVNFGTGAFFGVGAYTAVFLIKAAGAPLPVQILAAAAVGGALGFGAGLLTLRLRGIFFSIATVAVAIILQTVVLNWRYLGGATGVQILRPPVTAPFDSYTMATSNSSSMSLRTSASSAANKSPSSPDAAQAVRSFRYMMYSRSGFSTLLM